MKTMPGRDFTVGLLLCATLLASFARYAAAQQPGEAPTPANTPSSEEPAPEGDASADAPSKDGGSGQDAPGQTDQAAAPPAAAPDLVRLHDGSIYRGTIAELVPGKHLLFLTVTGETRRFEMGEVEYAGAAAQAPPASPAPTPAGRVGRRPGAPLVTVLGDEARLRFTANQPYLTFHVSSGVGRSQGTVVGVSPYPHSDWFVGNVTAFGQSFDRICTAPCEASLPVGTYTLAASIPDEELVIVDEPVVLRRSGTVRANYESKAGIRTAGWILGGSTLVAGVALSLVGYYVRSTPEDCEAFCEEESSTAMMLTGIGIAFAGVIAGTIMVATPDQVTLSFTPDR